MFLLDSREHADAGRGRRRRTGPGHRRVGRRRLGGDPTGEGPRRPGHRRHQPVEGGGARGHRRRRDARPGRESCCPSGRQQHRCRHRSGGGTVVAGVARCDAPWRTLCRLRRHRRADCRTGRADALPEGPQLLRMHCSRIRRVRQPGCLDRAGRDQTPGRRDLPLTEDRRRPGGLPEERPYRKDRAYRRRRYRSCRGGWPSVRSKFRRRSL